jgi:transcriptional regulator with XRE-family HTH domain
VEGMETAKFFRELRKDRELTQSRLAAICGQSLDWVRAVENRRISKLPTTTADRLSAALGIHRETLDALRPSATKAKPHRLLVPPGIWNDLERAASAAGVSAQEYALGLLRMKATPAHGAKPLAHQTGASRRKGRASGVVPRSGSRAGAEAKDHSPATPRNQ